MSKLVARIVAIALAAAIVVTGTASGASALGVPSGIGFVGSDCCQSASEEEDEQQDVRLNRVCCCRPAPFSQILTDAPVAIGIDRQGALVEPAPSRAIALEPAALDQQTCSRLQLWARGPPGLATSLYSQHTSLLL